MSEAHKDAEREAFEAACQTLASMPEEAHEKLFGNDDLDTWWALWKEARAASPQAPAVDGAEGRISVSLTYGQVSALYLTLLRRERPAFGWMEEPLVAIEAALQPAHNAIHDRGFNDMNRRFFGDDRFKFEEGVIPTEVAPASPAAESKTLPRESEGGYCQARANGEGCNCASACARWVAASGVVKGETDHG